MTEPFDRTGYTVIEQIPPGGGQKTWSVVRDKDGSGLGAYASEETINLAIERDRAAS